MTGTTPGCVSTGDLAPTADLLDISSEDMCEAQLSEEAKERECGPHQESPGSTVAIVCHNPGSQSITVYRCHLEQPLASTGDKRTTV